VLELYVYKGCTGGEELSTVPQSDSFANFKKFNLKNQNFFLSTIAIHIEIRHFMDFFKKIGSF
jgi:hypothetical protein